MALIESIGDPGTLTVGLSIAANLQPSWKGAEV